MKLTLCLSPESPSSSCPGCLHGCCRRRNAKTAKCAVCEQPTQGIFNVANDIVKKMKKATGKG